MVEKESMENIGYQLKSLLEELTDPETKDHVFSQVKLGFGDNTELKTRSEKPLAVCYISGVSEYGTQTFGVTHANIVNTIDSMIALINDGSKYYNQLVHAADLINDKFRTDKKWIYLNSAVKYGTKIHQCIISPPDKGNDIGMSAVFILRHRMHGNEAD